MSGHEAIAVDKLARLIGLPTAPLLIDVRVAEDFAADPRLIPGSSRGKHDDPLLARLEYAGRTCVIICQRGAKLSQGVAALLRHAGVDAISLTGGFEAWRDQTLPLVPDAAIPRNSASRTRWVTRHRPKIDRIACPWLIRRFVDRDAEFLFVPPDDVAGVAERFHATPFDMSDGFWTHRGNTCTFDTMLQEFGLLTEPLGRMAEIIRAADLGELQASREAAGLLAISLGLSRQYSSDLAQMEAGLPIYDALYRWCRDATDETHNWPASGKSGL
jgi:rhodanese-related sulfurtransferase